MDQPCSVPPLMSCTNSLLWLCRRGFLQARPQNVLDHLEHDELGRRSRYHRDLDDKLPLSPDFWRIQGLVHAHAERMVGCISEKCTLLPLITQKSSDQPL